MFSSRRIYSHAIKWSRSAADTFLEIFHFCFTELQKENKLTVKKTDKTPLDVRVVN